MLGPDFASGDARTLFMVNLQWLVREQTSKAAFSKSFGEPYRENRFGAQERANAPNEARSRAGTSALC